MNKSDVRVSVVVPAFNARATIYPAVRSGLQQTQDGVEVLVVDDASTDGTTDAVLPLASRDRRVRVLRHRTNFGPAAARNTGMTAARGTWIAMLDADDTMPGDRIEQLIATAEHHAADVVSDDLLLCATQGSADGTPMIGRAALGSGGWMSAAAFVSGNVGSRWTPRVSYGFMKPVLRREFLERHALHYDERNRFGEDYLFALSCLLQGARWWVTPDPMYRYTVRQGTLTDVQSAGDLLRIRMQEQELLRSHPMVAADPGLARALRRHSAVVEHFYYYREFTDRVKAGEMAPALDLLLRSPRSFRHIVTEGAMQAPRVTLKALRGGFRAPRVPLPAGGGRA